LFAALSKLITNRLLAQPACRREQVSVFTSSYGEAHLGYTAAIYQSFGRPG
jgi:hypothetical protein